MGVGWRGFSRYPAHQTASFGSGVTWLLPKASWPPVFPPLPASVEFGLHRRRHSLLKVVLRLQEGGARRKALDRCPVDRRDWPANTKKIPHNCRFGVCSLVVWVDGCNLQAISRKVFQRFWTRNLHHDPSANHPLPLVRQPGRRGCKFLHRHLQELEDQLMTALLKIKKIDLAALERAFAG